MRGFGVLEDVPMIVPIVLALFVFFGALGWATSAVNRTNSEVDMSLALIRVADAFAQWGVLTDDTWKTSCEAVTTKIQDVGFTVCLTSPEQVGNVLNSIKNDIKSGNQICGGMTYSCASAWSQSHPPRRGAPLLVRYFPVVFQTSTDTSVRNDVNFMVVVVWPRE